MPLLQSDSTGMASAFISKPFRVRPEGQSIVIHDTTAAKGKIACADLMESTMGAVTNSGNFQRFPDTATTLTGSATMVRNGDSTRVSVKVSGLLPNTAYGCHVHNLPGTLQKGGGHYMIDPTVTTAMEANEIWLNFTTDASGDASKTVTSMTKARPEAQSIVIHAPGGTRIGWADLMPSVFTGLGAEAIQSGMLATTAAGTAAGYASLQGKGLMVRADNRTVAALSVTGLVPNKAYGSHVHDMPCAQSGGGAHYKIDTTITTTSEANEIWTMLKTDGNGAATGFALAAGHWARRSAQSIVIHDTATAARIACLDFMPMSTWIGSFTRNPAAEYALVDLGSNTYRIQAQGNYAILLYDAHGKRVLARSGSGTQLLHLDGIAKGRYFLSLRVAGRTGPVRSAGIFIH